MYQPLIFLALVSGAAMAGLMAVLLTVMRPMWRDQADEVAARGVKDFLALASRNPILVVLSVLPAVVGAIVGGIL